GHVGAHGDDSLSIKVVDFFRQGRVLSAVNGRNQCHLEATSGPISHTNCRSRMCVNNLNLIVLNVFAKKKNIFEADPSALGMNLSRNEGKFCGQSQSIGDHGDLMTLRS